MLILSRAITYINKFWYSALLYTSQVLEVVKMQKMTFVRSFFFSNLKTQFIYYIDVVVLSNRSQ